MKIHKRLIDLESPAEVVKQIVSLSFLCPLTPSQSESNCFFLILKTSMSIESGVEVEVTIAAN
jgi:hypothetical protein